MMKTTLKTFVRPAFAASGLMAMCLLGACSGSETDKVPSDLNDTVEAQPSDLPSPGASLTPEPVPTPTPGHDDTAAIAPPADDTPPPSPSAQMTDDADATGMTARLPRDVPPEDTPSDDTPKPGNGNQQ